MLSEKLKISIFFSLFFAPPAVGSSACSQLLSGINQGYYLAIPALGSKNVMAAHGNGWEETEGEHVNQAREK